MVKRVYAIEFNLYESKGGSFKYAFNPKYERKIEYFDKTERDKFINRYLSLIEPNKDLYIDNIKCYVADLNPIEDMESVINAV